MASSATSSRAARACRTSARATRSLVLTGKDAGKRGTVQRVLRNPQGYKKTVSQATARTGLQAQSPLAGVAVVVEGMNIAKRHTKPQPEDGSQRPPAARPAGRHPRAGPAIPASNVMIICPNCGKPTRVKHGTGGDGRSDRVCSHCGENLTREAQKHD